MNCTRRGGATVARNTYILEKKMAWTHTHREDMEKEDWVA